MPMLCQANYILLLILECLEVDIRESSSVFVGSTFYTEKGNNLNTESKQIMLDLKNKNNQSIKVLCLE